MKFSLIIPTHNRHQLVSLALKYALQQDHPNYEIIVSDNSTNDRYRNLNLQALKCYAHFPNLRIVYPPRVLSAPEHFEFALQQADGDYVSFLTDKMIIFPHLLKEVESLIQRVGNDLDIINWMYHIFSFDNHNEPFGSGTLHMFEKFSDKAEIEIDPVLELSNKASGIISRIDQSVQSYVTGKVCFGFYSRNLIKRVNDNSGSLFGGVTHDYSAMVQALLLARRVFLLTQPKMLFLSHDKVSIGKSTHLDSISAIKYYDTFLDSDKLLNTLFIPNLYSSQHNMVASDYVKYLKMYNKFDLFLSDNWIFHIWSDLFADGKTWASDLERSTQLDIFMNFVYETKGLDYEIKHHMVNASHPKYRKILNLLKRFIRLFLLNLTHIFPDLLKVKSWFRPKNNSSLSFSSLDDALVSIHPKS